MESQNLSERKNNSGEFIITSAITKIQFQNGTVWSANGGDTTISMRRQENNTIIFEYNDANDKEEQMSILCDSLGYIIYTIDGEISDFKNGFAVIKDEDGDMNYINENGKELLEFWPDQCTEFQAIGSCKFAIVMDRTGDASCMNSKISTPSKHVFSVINDKGEKIADISK